MPKIVRRSHSRLTREAASLLGKMIRQSRIERGLSTVELANRAGISRALLQRIERGEPSASIGAAFEAAVVAGVPLFDAGSDSGLSRQIASVDHSLKLLPKTAYPSRKRVKDAF